MIMEESRFLNSYAIFERGATPVLVASSRYVLKC